MSIDTGKVNRRSLIRAAGVGAGALGVLYVAGCGGPTEQAAEPPSWDKTFPKSDSVDVERVSFVNRLGIDLVGDLYAPANIDRSTRSPAIIVGHPYGGVKEQTSGLYAQSMAERGYVTLAFDNSYGGESGGQPRAIASPEAFVEDFSAAVDHLGSNPLVDRDRIGVIGVCASGGWAVSAAQIDHRIRALATVSMYDMGRLSRQGLHDSVPEDQWMATLDDVGEQRWAEAGGAERRMVGLPRQLTPDTSAADREFYDYYRTPRGRHPRSTTEFTFTGSAVLNNFHPFAQIETISPRPLLLIVGEHAHSRYFSEDAFGRAAEPKEMYVVPGAGHVDLYDRIGLIPFGKLQMFFDQHLDAA
ncbi:hypothetical protein BA059_27435 [Mycolicibacterium sp. (ex Dasyatis americana)]|nr:hypothetical protein BA059_27435 [Mycolicibacterium sp. (ex Dasyatis americana)]